MHRSIINGVVYNEMKGAYSSPDEVLETAIEAALFPGQDVAVRIPGEIQESIFRN